MRYRVTMKGSEVVACEETAAPPEAAGTLILEIDSEEPIAKGNMDPLITAVVGALGMSEDFATILALFSK